MRLKGEFSLSMFTKGLRGSLGRSGCQPVFGGMACDSGENQVRESGSGRGWVLITRRLFFQGPRTAEA